MTSRELPSRWGGWALSSSQRNVAVGVGHFLPSPGLAAQAWDNWGLGLHLSQGGWAFGMVRQNLASYPDLFRPKSCLWLRWAAHTYFLNLCFGAPA